MLLLVALLSLISPSLCHDDDCCKIKKVGGTTYTLKQVGDLSKLKQNGCTSPCIYAPENDDSKRFCFGDGDLDSQCVADGSHPIPLLSIKEYCQPSNSTCWPTATDISEFRKNFSGDSCLGLPRFLWINDPDVHTTIKCKDYQGLQYAEEVKNYYGNKVNGGSIIPPSGCQLSITSKPNEYCCPNPFITGTYYQDGPTTSTTTISATSTTTKKPSYPQKACMTAYQFLTNRNFFAEWKPAFIVTANTTEDIQNALKFANKHNLGVSIMGTGHELSDRNAGPGPNSLLIRTTCFRAFNFSNDPFPDYNNTEWKDGHAVVGAGQTWGLNYWWNLENYEGVYALAAEKDKEAVGGTCHSVGVVGWTLGGGRGWTSPQYGVGVDQLLAATIVTASGEVLTASYTQNTDLLKALKGGGPGFGVITDLTLKLHTPKCGTMTKCYSMYTMQWRGKYEGASTLTFIQKLFKLYVEFSTSTRDKGWNTAFNFNSDPRPTENTWTILLDLRFFGSTDGFSDIHPDIQTKFDNELQSTSSPDITFKICIHTQINEYWCDVDIATCARECTFQETHLFSRIGYNIPFFMFQLTEETAKNGEFVKDFFDIWTPLCKTTGKYSGCINGWQLRGDYPAVIDGKHKYSTPSVIGSENKKASFCVYLADIQSTTEQSLTLQEKMNVAHYEIAPVMYKYSKSSYFNEVEYTLKPGEWIKRFWDEETYENFLVPMKKQFDPEVRFACRHCVGDLNGDNLGN